ncbi:MAG TPA: hypothetical protein VG345_04055 [Bryobacteraceae bacterium]|jgi:hypothetical protein|nr:hypothetical protein [Bryobacteraceae bacterium]
MTNKLRTIAVSLSLAFCAAPVFGADSYNLRVSVPFDFTVGKTFFPAGDYRISEQETNGILTIEGPKAAAMTLTSFGSIDPREAPGLSFQRTSKGVVLKAVHTWGHPANVIAGEEMPQQ